MNRSVATAAAETRQQNLPSPSGRSVDAGLRPKLPETFLRPIAKEVIQREGQDNAATTIGISEGRLSAKLGDGTFNLKELEALGPEVAVTFAEEVLKRLGPLCTPKARGCQLLRDIEQRCDEIRQLLEMAL